MSQPASHPVTDSAASTAELISGHDRFMTRNYPRYPVAFVRGHNAELFDAEGRRYLDLFAGFGASMLGHAHPELAAAVSEQAARLWHVGNLLHTEPQVRVAEAIHRIGFQGRSFFCHSGADANDAALKLARLYGKQNPGQATGAWGRYKMISATQSFHGRSFGTMPATGAAVGQGFEPHLPGYTQVPFNDVDAVAAAIEPETVAVLVEPIQGEGGIHEPDDDYFPKLRQLCDEHDLLLLLDEVWCGGGRTGQWFGHQHFGITPDTMSLGKGVGGGLPVGVMCAAERVAELFDHTVQQRVVHATTLGGNCLGMAAAATVFEVVQRDGLLERAAELGGWIKGEVLSWRDELPMIREVRGRGLFLGIELDPRAGGAWFEDVKPLVSKCLERGLLINGTQGTVLRLAPPLTIERATLEEGLGILKDTLSRG